jgi:hypothetical protein
MPAIASNTHPTEPDQQPCDLAVQLTTCGLCPPFCRCLVSSVRCVLDTATHEQTLTLLMPFVKASMPAPSTTWSGCLSRRTTQPARAHLKLTGPGYSGAGPVGTTDGTPLSLTSLLEWRGHTWLALAWNHKSVVMCVQFDACCDH